MRIFTIVSTLLSLCAASAVADVRIERKNVRSGNVDIPVEVAIPDGRGPFPAVLYVHARRGYEDPDRAHIRTLAEQGFLVVAPDWQSGRFIERWPTTRDAETEGDFHAALDLRLAVGIRLDPEEEFEGADLSIHRISPTPERGEREDRT